MKKVEVLAPAGSLDICKAVIRAGADAVYLGGDMFGARAYAGNLNHDELLEAIEFAHLRDARIYLTVNTLLKENEINDRLVSYIRPFYEAGLDAAIVQDFGVFNVLRHHFPEMALHASTQMTITGVEGAKILKKLGASRVVTARELTAQEIKRIHDEVDIEIESFVHGALCYCYSGQCLLSSMNGSRSGNRGRCAQSCRLAYDVIDKSKKINKDDKNYPLSPKDMCALSVLPDVLDAGVYSLKIEGRMKNVTYAAAVTETYRRYVDMYLDNGRDGYSVDKKVYDDLMDIYNRGAFTSGYYKEEKGRGMMSIKRPNHMGTLALEIVNNVNGRVTFKALEEINPQDVFEVDEDNSFSSGAAYKTGDTFVVNLPKKYPLYKGRKLYRMRNNRITTRVNDLFVADEKRGCRPVDMALTAFVGEPVCLKVRAIGFEAEVAGAPVEKALKSATDEVSVREKLMKLGNTAFVAGDISVCLGDDVFIPATWINDLRREAIAKLSESILESYRREYKPELGDGLLEVRSRQEADEYENPDESCKAGNDCLASRNENNHINENGVNCYISGQNDNCNYENGNDTSYDIARKRNIIKVAVSGKFNGKISNIGKLSLPEICDDKIGTVYIEWDSYGSFEAGSYKTKGLGLFESKAIKPILALPHIITASDTDKCADIIRSASTDDIDTFLVRNLEEIGLLGRLLPGAGVVTDANLYCWNSMACSMLKHIVTSCGLKLVRITLPYELTAGELSQIHTDCATELVTGGDIPVMVSKQCVRKTYGICDRSCGETVLCDKRKNITYRVLSKCDFCYSLMLNSKPLLADDKIIRAVKPDYIRTVPTTNSGKNVDTCQGHFITGVE